MSQNTHLEPRFEGYGDSSREIAMSLIYYNAYKSYNLEIAMRSTRSMVIRMRLPAESGKRLKRMANGMDGPPATPVHAWWRRACVGRNLDSSTFEIRLPADRPAFKGARSPYGR